MKTCPSCGTQNSDELLTCSKCNEPLSTPNTTLQNTKSPIKKYLKIILLVVAMIIIFSILIATHVICINHNWSTPTCVSVQLHI